MGMEQHGARPPVRKTGAEYVSALRHALAAERPLAPFVNPRIAAQAALLAIDLLAQPENKARLEALAGVGTFDLALLERAENVARALLYVVDELGPPPAPPASDGDLPADAVALRERMLEALHQTLDELDEPHLWLDAVRLSSPADLAFDLRILAYVSDRYREALGESSPLLDGDATWARALADDVEYASFGERMPAQIALRDTLGRCFAMLVPAYDELVRVGRFVGGGSPETDLPSLAAIARARRIRARGQRRKPASAVTIQPAGEGRAATAAPASVQTSEGARAEAAMAAGRDRAAGAAPFRMAPPPLPSTALEAPMAGSTRGDPPIADMPIVDQPIAELPIADRPIADPPIADPPIADPPIAETPITDPAISAELAAALASAGQVVPALDWILTAPTFSKPPDGRGDERTFVELEVSIGTESNFFLGFAENLSAGGLFVATYKMLPIGHEIAIDLTLPGGRKLELHGVVRWVRLPSASRELWPGLGVQFEGLSAEQEALIREFLRMREPLFYEP